jgi:hypothetical protein
MYIAGDFWRICDRCGFKTRASATRKQWDGQIVCLADFEERHPQDFVKGRKDIQNVPDPRPEAIDSIIGPLTTSTTAISLPGSSTLLVESSLRFLAADRIGVMLSDGSLYRAIVLTVPDASTITLTIALPGTVPSGALVIDYSAVAQPDLG